MQLPLNFKTKEQVESFTMYFDGDRVNKIIKVEDF